VRLEAREIGRALTAAVVAAAMIEPLGIGIALVIGVSLWAGSCLAQWLRPGSIAFARERVRFRLAARRGPSVAGHLEAVATPGSALGSRAIRFVTDEQDRRLINTGQNGKPVGIRFEAPVEQEVSASNLPVRMKAFGRTILCVDQFVAEGVVIVKQLPGVEVVAEVSY
jgi:hypothetical protein